MWSIVYAVVPMFAMPGYVAVWGGGSLIFLALAALTAGAVQRGRKRRRAAERSGE